MTETLWRGAALIRPGILAFTGSIGATGRHAHHAVQIMAARTPVAVADAAGQRHNGTTERTSSFRPTSRTRSTSGLRPAPSSSSPPTPPPAAPPIGGPAPTAGLADHPCPPSTTSRLGSPGLSPS
ncbi:hypothetical protein [Rhodococcus opacus]|uniref:hypothetical protein n=1 Tax=Rhodococcus opacus TaxID=37919 RepID=UPI000A6CE2FE|nr:hypothetical protein [Rhodococcus opacus]